jgi:hypothetical protein
MRILRRLTLFISSALLLLVLLFSGLVGWFLWQAQEVGAGYCAKLMATGVFVLGRTPESIREQELGFLPLFNYEIDHEGKTVTGWIFERTKRTAVYREGLGVALALDGDVEKLRAQARPNLVPDLSALKQLPWRDSTRPSSPLPWTTCSPSRSACTNGTPERCWCSTRAR